MDTRHTEYAVLLAEMLECNQKLRDDSKDSPELDPFFDGKIMAFRFAHDAFCRTFRIDLAVEEK